MNRALLLSALLSIVGLAGCVTDDTPLDTVENVVGDLVPATFNLTTIPAVFGEPIPVSPRELQDSHIGLYEPTIDVGPDGTIYVSSHSADVGVYPAPAHFSIDDGATWQSMALFMDYQGSPEQHMSAPLFSDEVFIIAGEAGQAWGVDCCTNDNAFPLVGWGNNGATVDYYNQNARDLTRHIVDPLLTGGECVPTPTTDRPWAAYNNGKLLMVNNPGGSLVSANGQIPIQVAIMDTPPATPIAYTGTPWGIEWNYCASPGGFIPGIPDMRADHFWAVPQWVDFRGDACDPTWTSHYTVTTGQGRVANPTTTFVFENTHVAPAEEDSTPSTIGHYGQAVFDATGTLFVGAMNNTAMMNDAGDCIAKPGVGAIHLAVSTDDAATFTETTFTFDSPVSAYYMDGNRQGEGFLLNWGQIDGNHTDWYVAHIFANDDGTLRLENKMLLMDDGPEASRHVQGAALGPDGRAYAVLSWNSQNPGASDRAEDGDTPLFVAVQMDGPTMPVDA